MRQRPLNVRGAIGSAGNGRWKIAYRRLAAVAIGGAFLACSEATSAPPAAGGTGATPSDDAGAPDGGGVDSGLVCAEPIAISTADAGTTMAPALAIGELQGIGVSVRDGAGTTGIDGTALLIQSRLGGDGPPSTPAELSTPSGKLCLSGNTVIVPLMSFAEYWGAGISLYLQTQATTGALAADAGPADAGTPAIEGFSVFSWDPAPGNVVGFSFVVESNDETLPCGGLPPLFRIQISPTGSDPTSDIYCRDFRELASGERLDVLFSEVTRECWAPGGRPIFANPLPAGNQRELFSLSMIVPADEIAPFDFDLCISDFRPILGE